MIQIIISCLFILIEDRGVGAGGGMCGDTLHVLFFIFIFIFFWSGSLIFDVDSLGNGRCTLRNNDDSLYDVFLFLVATEANTHHDCGQQA